MDLSKYDMETLLLAAIKSEVESRDIYNNLADRVNNAFLKDRLRFLAKEEEGHRSFLEGVYRNKYPGKEIVLPEKTDVPLPSITMAEDTTPQEVMAQAMDAELAAYDYYNAMADTIALNSDIKRTLKYMAVMEMGHYKLLEIEKEALDRLGEFDDVWDMMHIGP